MIELANRKYQTLNYFYICYSNIVALISIILLKSQSNLTKMEPSETASRNVQNCKLFFVYVDEQLTIRANQYISSSFCKPTCDSNTPSAKTTSEKIQSKSKDAKSLNKYQLVKIYVGRFTYDTLPEDCRIWFGSVKQIYEAFEDEKASEIAKTDAGIEVRLKFKIYKNEKEFTRFSKFELKQIGEEQRAKSQEMEQENEENSLMESKQKAQSHKDQQLQVEQSHMKYIKQEIKNICQKIDQAYENSQKMKQTADHLQQFVESFIDKMQQKWQKVLNDMQCFKNNQMKNEQIIEKLTNQNPRSPLVQQQPLKLVKLNYKFSETEKNQSIKLISPQIAKCNSNDHSLKIVMIDPTTFLTAKDPYKRYFEINLKIREISGYIALGICEKEIIKALRYKSFETDVKSHGCYLIDWNGETWSNYRTEDNNSKPTNALKFHKNDIVTLTFKTNRKILKISKKSKNYQPAHMMINPSVPLNDLCFCVFLSGCGDEVEIFVQQNKPSVINLEDCPKINE